MMSDIPLTIIVDGIWRRPGRFKRWQMELSRHGVEAVEYEYDSSGRVAIDQLGARFAEWLRGRNRPVSVIGFSMGGLVIRAAHQRDPELQIMRAAFLNTPHCGTWMAWALPLPAVKQMRPNSTFLRGLDQVMWNIPTLAVYCPGDAMVLPGIRARFVAASESIASPVPAHMWPVFSPSIRRKVVRFLVCGRVVTGKGRAA